MISVPTNTIFFDESGSTELGFRDLAQPFITFASHSASEKGSKEAINKYFPNTQTTEIKYSRQKKRPDRIINIFRCLNEKGAAFKTYNVYKPFFLFHSFLYSLNN